MYYCLHTDYFTKYITVYMVCSHIQCTTFTEINVCIRLPIYVLYTIVSEDLTLFWSDCPKLYM